MTLDQTMDLGMYYSSSGNRDVTLAKKYLFATLESSQNNLGDENKTVVRKLVGMRMNLPMELVEYDKVLVDR
ncbi:MAG: hypothetical protein ACI94Y_002598 [Maribacter sp.]